MTARGPLWRRVLADLLGARRPPASFNRSVEHRSATQIYLDGGGNPADERTMAILAEADRPMPERPVSTSPLHAHEITADDAALMRMMRGANFGPNATVTLPSGRTVTGAEMQLWLNADDR